MKDANPHLEEGGGEENATGQRSAAGAAPLAVKYLRDSATDDSDAVAGEGPQQGHELCMQGGCSRPTGWSSAISSEGMADVPGERGGGGGAPLPGSIANKERQTSAYVCRFTWLLSSANDFRDPEGSRAQPMFVSLPAVGCLSLFSRLPRSPFLVSLISPHLMRP